MSNIDLDRQALIDSMPSDLRADLQRAFDNVPRFEESYRAGATLVPLVILNGAGDEYASLKQRLIDYTAAHYQTQLA